MRVITAMVALMCLPIAVSAHHSRAEFSDRGLELEGELLSVRWRNPHPLFSLRTVNDNGDTELWRLEAYGNALTLQRTGVTGELFSNGDYVRVVGNISARQDRVLLATHMLLADGTEAVLEYDAEPYWSEQHVGGKASWTIDESLLRSAAAENRGIFRVWSLPRRGLDVRYSPFTEAAIAGRAAWDTLDNYLTRCEPPGMPHSMSNPQRYEFVEDNGNILVRAQFFNMVRTVHLQDAANPEDQPASKLGYSVGHWEGNTLVIETTRIDWPYFDTSGTPQSEAVEVVERITLSDDQSRLDFHMTITDPATFTEPATFDRYWLALGSELQHYECEIG